jgi:serine phosphatase RsbU (regulator of sigma subunit)
VKMRHAFLLLAFIISFNFSNGQERGRRFIRNYTPKEYGAGLQNWAIVQDKRGVLYIANNSGVLEFNGTTWELIYITEAQHMARCLAINDEGRIYVGSRGQIGYLAPDKLGTMKFYSLNFLLPEPERNYKEVWKVHVKDRKVYFQTDESIIIIPEKVITAKITPAEKVVKIIKSQSPLDKSFFAGERLVAFDNVGLLVLEGDSLMRISGGEAFVGKKVNGIFPIGAEEFLVGSRTDGLLKMSFQYSDSPNSEGISTGVVLEDFGATANPFLIANQLYVTLQLSTGNFALGTLRGGVVVVNKAGEILEIFDPGNGLQDATVISLFEDSSKGLIAGLGNGISRIEITSPFQYWEEQDGLNGYVHSILRHENHLYATSTLGLFRLQDHKFQQIEKVSTQCWHLLPVEVDNRKLLLASSNQGVFVIQNGKVLDLIPLSYAFYLYEFEGQIFVASRDGIYILGRRGGNWYSSKVNGIDEEVRIIKSDKDGNLWLNTRGNKVIKYNPTSKHIKFYAQEHGLPMMRDIQIYTFNGEVIFAAESGLYKFDKAGEKFYADSTLGVQFGNGSTGVFPLVQDAWKNVWLRAYNKNGTWIEGYLHGKDGNFTPLIKPFKRLPSMYIQSIYPEGESKVWLGGSEGIYLYERDRQDEVATPYHSLILKVKTRSDSVIFQGSYFELLNDEVSEDSISNYKVASLKQPAAQVPVLRFEDNSLVFSFSAAYFDNDKQNQFSFRLEGYDKSWSKWSAEAKASYTNLPEGDYLFTVKALNTYGVESEIASYKFSILPPWYRTYWAYFIYLISLGGFVVGLIRLNTHRLKLEKEELERVILLRTAEIALQKKEIEKQRDNLLELNEEIQQQSEEIMAQRDDIEDQKNEIAKINEDITASITYAKRIQTAMLPFPERLKNSFEEYFILFRPRDIVSGDFYWFADTKDIVTGSEEVEGKGKIIFAVADCTGHGVPGAFMSMIGNELLNDIVIKRKIYEPDIILNQLHKGIRYALRQDRTENRDGMDVALVVIDRDEKTLSFAGAKNPMYLFYNNEPILVKGDKVPIGGSQHEEERIFTKHVFSISGECIFYLFTDGYQDQFGGPDNKKFMVKRFKQMLEFLYRSNFKEQKDVLEEELDNWIGYDKQIDDILVVGVKIVF